MKIFNIIEGFWLWLFSDWKTYQKERLAICDECAPQRDTCPVCLCFKEAKAKVKSEACPKDKWNNLPKINASELRQLTGEGRKRNYDSEIKEEYFKQMNIQ